MKINPPDNESKPFVPAWWCHNRHLQTVWRKFFGDAPLLPLRRERWTTEDEDFLDLDFLEPSPENGAADAVPTVLFLHGLEGSSQAKYILGMLKNTMRLGWRGVALNFRSCSGEMNRQRRFYHSGETGDLGWVIDRLHERYTKAVLFVVGFSLGGNVLLKWLGENGTKADLRVQAAVAISVPFDLGIAARRIDSGFGKIYGRNFLLTLKQKLLEKEAAYPGLIDRDLVQGIKSYIDFEDKLFAPIHHFSGAEEYWRSCSAKYFIDGICRPTLILHANDDPFLPGCELPMKQLRESLFLDLELSARGGHAGFVGGSVPWKAGYWAECRTMRFLESFSESKKTGPKGPV